MQMYIWIPSWMLMISSRWFGFGYEVQLDELSRKRRVFCWNLAKSRVDDFVGTVKLVNHRYWAGRISRRHDKQSRFPLPPVYCYVNKMAIDTVNLLAINAERERGRTDITVINLPQMISKTHSYRDEIRS